MALSTDSVSKTPYFIGSPVSDQHVNLSSFNPVQQQIKLIV